MANNIRALSSFLQGLKRKSNPNEDEPRHKINLRDLSADDRSDDMMSANGKREFSYDERLNYDRDQFKCPDCNVYCTSQPNLEQHNKGRRHLEVIGQLERRNREELTLSEDEKIRNVMESLGDNKQYFELFRDQNGRISFHCILCNVNIQAVDTKVHCSGRRHGENVLDTTDNRNPIDMEIENDEENTSERKVEMTKDRQLQMSRENRSTRYNKHYNSVDEETHANLEKLKQILDQREHILDLKERRLNLREAECSKREEEVAQREVKLRLEEVKLLSAVNNKELSKNDMLLKRLHGIGENTKEDELAIEHLKPSEKRYYSELVTQKKEIMIAYNTITEKRGLTMEERLAKSKLKIALEDIQMAMNNLTRKGKSEQNQINNNSGPAGSSKDIKEEIMDPPPNQHDSENDKDNNISPQDSSKSPGRNLSKENLKKQMEEKLLKEMNKGSLAKLAKIIAQTPSMKAVLENIEKTQDNEVKETPKSPDPVPENQKKNPEEKPPSPTQKKVLLNSPPGIHPERYHGDRHRSEDHPDRRREHPDYHIMREREERHRREQELIKRERELRERHEHERREREHHEREREHHERERRIREHHERREGPLLEHPPPIHRRPLLEPPRMEHHHERNPEHHRHREEFRPKEIYDEEFFVGKRFPPPSERDVGLLPKPVPPPTAGSSKPVILPDTGKYGIRPHPLSKQKPALLPRPYDTHFY